MTTGVIDRIKAHEAVILVGDDEVEFIVPLTMLPEGAREGDWVKVVFNQGEVVHVEMDLEKTQKRKEHLQAKLAKLHAKKRSKYKS